MGTSRYLFDDNPATEDLTGLRSVAVAVVNVVVDSRFDTVTVGLNSPWGGGKSTALNLIASELRLRDDVIVVVIDPWEFVDSGDPRGTLITRVLEGIAAELDAWQQDRPRDGKAKLADAAADLVTKLNALRKRVSWSKVAQVAIKSAVTLTPDIGGIVEALTPEPQEEPAAKGMRGFRDDFGELLTEMDGARVVVLIDDLDVSHQPMHGFSKTTSRPTRTRFTGPGVSTSQTMPSLCHKSTTGLSPSNALDSDRCRRTTAGFFIPGWVARCHQEAW